MSPDAASMESQATRNVSSSLCHMLQPTFSRLLRSGSGDKAKQKQNYLESAEEEKKGGQDKGHKAQHRKFPMNLGGIFSICLVLFVGSFKLYRLELSMLGSPQKENATVFAGPSMCLSEYSVPSVCHPVMRVPQVQHQILQSECHSCFHRTPFCAPISLILVEWQSSLFCCLQILSMSLSRVG